MTPTDYEFFLSMVGSLIVLLGLFVVIAFVIGHWHEPCFTFNMTEDFWGVCR